MSFPSLQTAIWAGTYGRPIKNNEPANMRDPTHMEPYAHRPVNSLVQCLVLYSPALIVYDVSVKNCMMPIEIIVPVAGLITRYIP